ncbi:TniQ family protein [Serratia sp. NPDC087055]|uniref:TniQ family protein n=1 Tax=Serratia sp. NPDC087055 TaxID=3364516 RepID=UPI00384F1264
MGSFLMWSVISDCAGESLSSWLVRMALAAGCDPLSLTHTLWPGWRTWTHDVDRVLTKSQLSVLQMHSGLSDVSLHHMTLAGLLGNPVGQPLQPINGKITGVIPLGIRNRSCLGGVQFCPKCLSEDKHPYFRLMWRLSFSTVCLKHQCLLKMGCPHCGESVQYHRLTAPDENIHLCFRCLTDLREAFTEQAELQAMAFQQFALGSQGYQNSVVACGKHNHEDWLVIEFFVRLIRYATRKHGGALNELFSYAGIPVRKDIVGPLSLPLEYLSVSDRARLFSVAWPLILGGPAQFSMLARKYGLTFNGLSAFSPPDCLKILLADLPLHHVPHAQKQSKICLGVRSRRSVEHQWALLLRRSRVGKYE